MAEPLLTRACRREAVERTPVWFMADITTPRDLFLHELGDILYVEQKLTEEVLPKLKIGRASCRERV